MKLTLDAEQQLLQDSVARFVSDHVEFDKRLLSGNSAAGSDPANWRMLAEHGWLAATVPEQYGGLGGSVIDTAIIAQQLGRGLVTEPYLGCAILAIQTLLAAGTPEQCSQWLAPLLDGSRRWALAYSEPAARGMPEVVMTRAESSSRGYLLYGHKTLVLGAPCADRYIVSACIRNQPACEEISLFVVRADSPQLQTVMLPLHDGTLAAELSLDGVLAEAVLGSPGEGLTALREALSHAMLVLCAELIGGMERAIEITADYLRSRKQFGAALASFQSLQHRMADMAADMELARSLLFTALAAHGTGTSTTRYDTVGAAKAFITRAARHVCGEAIQLHGAIGMAEEYVVGHYFKRAVVADALLGSSVLHRQAAAQRLQQQIAAQQIQQFYRPAP